jgi:thiol-disulfide isomerase/thioredoxin
MDWLMSERLPETQIAGTPQKRPEKRLGWLVWIAGAILAVGLLYGVSIALPNRDAGQDLSRFKSGALAALVVNPKPPPQPVAPFTSAQGQATTLKAFHGKVVLVNLWATWCGPCVTEMPTLAALHSRFQAQGFEVVAISVDKDVSRDIAIAKLKDLSKDQLTFYHDPRMGVVFPMKARGFPTSVLYDRNGIEIARLAGEANWNSAEAHALIEAALLGR